MNEERRERGTLGEGGNPRSGLLQLGNGAGTSGDRGGRERGRERKKEVREEEEEGGGGRYMLQTSARCRGAPRSEGSALTGSAPRCRPGQPRAAASALSDRAPSLATSARFDPAPRPLTQVPTGPAYVAGGGRLGAVSRSAEVSTLGAS